MLDTLVSRVVSEVTKQLSRATPQATAVLPNPVADRTVPTSQPSTSLPVPPSAGELMEVPVVEPSTSTSVKASLVQDSIAAAQSVLSGETSFLNQSLPEQLFTSPSLSIDARVSDKLRSQIWNNEYVDFGALLSNPVFDRKYQLTIKSSDKESNPALCLEPVSKTKKCLSIESWLNCFYIFVGVYTRKYPNEAPALMKYGKVVQDLAARGQNWKFYDENFR